MGAVSVAAPVDGQMQCLRCRVEMVRTGERLRETSGGDYGGSAPVTAHSRPEAAGEALGR